MLKKNNKILAIIFMCFFLNGETLLSNGRDWMSRLHDEDLDRWSVLIIKEDGFRCKNFNNIDFYQACFSRRFFIFSSFFEADLTEASFLHCWCERTDFRKVKVDKTDFSYTDFLFANFEGTDLKDSCFFKCNLKNANFKEANLSNTDCSGADFYGTKLHGALIEGAKVKDANFKFALGLTNEQKQYLRENGAKNVSVDIICELEPEEDLEDYPEKVSYPLNDLSFVEKIKQCLMKKYKWYFQIKNQETQTDEIGI